MGDRCRTVSPLIGRVVDVEAAPSESYRLARHVANCTACRILLARERRLADALDGLDDASPDDAGLLERVMSSLARRRAPRPSDGKPSEPRRGLRLASFLAALPALELVRRAWDGLGWPGYSWNFGVPGVEAAPEALGNLAGAAGATLAATSRTFLDPLAFLPAMGIAAGTAVSLAGASLALASAAIVLAVGAVPRRLP